MSLGQTIELQPDETVQVAFITLAADHATRLLDVARRYQSWPASSRPLARPASRAELELRQSDLSTDDLEQIQTAALRPALSAILGCARTPRRWQRTQGASPACGLSASRATIRSCWCG